MIYQVSIFHDLRSNFPIYLSAPIYYYILSNLTGRETGSNGNLVNVALEGKATQDSTSLAGVASRAIDGNTEGDYFSGE